MGKLANNYLKFKYRNIFAKCIIQRMKAVKAATGTLCPCFKPLYMDSSTVTWWRSPFVSLGVSDLFYRFYSILMENPVNKKM